VPTEASVSALPSPIPPDAAAICGAFDLGRPVGPPTVAARGEQGRIWRLETDRGSWAAKELFVADAPTIRATTRADLAFQELALAAGVPMPRPIRSTGGEAVIDVGAERRARLVRVYSWVDLAGRDAEPPVLEVAAILGRLHAAAPRDERPMDPWTTTPPRAAIWPARLAAAMAANAPWAAALAALTPILEDTLAATGPVRAAGAITCHLDYNPENVLADVRGRPVVVDWENSGPAPAEQELASVVAEFVRDAAGTRPFLDAYEAAGGPGRLIDRSSFALTAIVQANLIETYSRRALDATAHDEDRGRAASWIADIAANVFSVERFDAWLAAAGGRAGASGAEASSPSRPPTGS
jgi:Ser/Thr protein kinase RdoA (MazF antagonist)